MAHKKKRGWIWLIVIVVIVVGGIFAFRYFKQQAAAAASALAAASKSTYTVERGNIDTLVKASGSLSAQQTFVATVPDKLEVTELFIKVGDVVKKGDPIAALDPESVRAQIFNLRKSVGTEESSLRKAGSYDSVLAPTEGRLVYQPVLEGDDVLDAMTKYGLLAILSADGWMRLDVKTDKLLKLDSRMIVKWDDGKTTGIVDRKTDDGYVILLPDADAPYHAAAMLMDRDDVLGSGTVEVNMPVEVYAFDGVIDTVRFHVGESVPDGKELFKLKHAATGINYGIKYYTREPLAEKYQALIRYWVDPRIVAEEDGVVTELMLAKDVLTGAMKAATGSAAASVENAAYCLTGKGDMLMTVNVDELDILKIQVGQTAEVSLDALPDETLTGTVTRVSSIGKTNNSISVYPVEISIDRDERLLAGMNGSATVQIDRAENILVIPLAAILEQNGEMFVNVRSGDGSAVRTAITTGRSNEEFAEVTSGVAEGDVLEYTLGDSIMDFQTYSTGDGEVMVTG